MRKTIVALSVAAAMTTAAVASDQIRIVGSSTVYPFTSYVAEEFAVTMGYKTPVIESTGSGGGMKIFCETGNGVNTPSFTNSSRPMKVSEFQNCQKNGVKNIFGIMIGYDGISIAQSKENPPLNLTKEQIFLALAKEVPSKDGKSLVKNPYKKWSDIDKSLPDREIRIIGAPTTSGTRDAFDEMVMEEASKSFPAYGGKKYKKYRNDGAFIPGGENDNLIVQQLAQDKTALGYFGYSFLEENHNRIQGVSIDGVAPTFESIASGDYPVARSLYVYGKTDHLDKVEGASEFLDLYMSDMMIGTDGILKTIGLIPMPEEIIKEAQDAAAKRTNLTEEMVRDRRVY